MYYVGCTHLTHTYTYTLSYTPPSELTHTETHSTYTDTHVLILPSYKPISYVLNTPRK